MDYQEIIFRLKKHQEHYRVLPAGAQNELASLISELETLSQPMEIGRDVQELEDRARVAKPRASKKKAKKRA